MFARTQSLFRTAFVVVRERARALFEQNRGSHPDSVHVDKVFSELASGLHPLIDGIQERLKEFRYPFSHARGQLTVAEYARSEKPADNEMERAYFEGAAHADRLFALHYRLVGKLLEYVDAAEKVLESQCAQH